MDRSVRCDVDVVAEPDAVRAFAQRLAAALGLEPPTPFPTAVVDAATEAPLDLYWCAGGRSDQGETLRLFAGPDFAELVVIAPGRTASSMLAAARAFLSRRPRDPAPAGPDLDAWRDRLAAAVAGAA